ncbi:hypothetical protein [Natronorubrum sp. DTA28]|uniref:hypothetical protein n=1 Tax=Natronorubrum sp. DTA28 TaxID=3447019 RepID=UPI003F839E3B
MTFLVLVQGYALFVEPLVSIAQAAFVAAIVGTGTAIGAYLLEHRVAAWSARRVTGATEPHGGDGKSKS